MKLIAPLTDREVEALRAAMFLAVIYYAHYGIDYCSVQKKLQEAREI